MFYVWFDALTTYMSAIGYGEEESGETDYERLWPIDVHLVGKEIVRFHAVYWPAFLMAANLPLPRQVWAHGWLIFQGGKMSKTKGNIVRALPIKEVVGTDGLRYYLLREIVFGSDGNFSHKALATRYNADLANGIGNLASRTVSMLSKYCGRRSAGGFRRGRRRSSGLGRDKHRRRRRALPEVRFFTRSGVGLEPSVPGRQVHR